jgi:hypothetical protein
MDEAIRVVGRGGISGRGTEMTGFAQWTAAALAALALGQATGPVRRHTFEDARDGGAPLANTVGPDGALTYALTPAAGAPYERFQIVEGRRRGLKALRLDRGVLSADAPPMGRSFAVAMWFRTYGHGSLRGNDNNTNGTLVSIGNGYWDGFRVTTTFPDNTFGFEIGRPAPQGSAGFFGCGPLPDGVWHHLAASWDGAEMRLYLNGLPAGSQPYTGAALEGDRIRIGYAGAGWGSARLDVDEVAFYTRPIALADSLRLALDGAALSDAQMAHISAGEAARARRDVALAAARWQSVADDPRASPDLVGLARLRLAEMRRTLGDGAASVSLLARAIEERGTPDRLRRTALSMLAASGQGLHSLLPIALLRRYAAMDGLPAPHRRELRLAVARALAASGRAAESRKEYAAVVADVTDPGARVKLRLEVARAIEAAGLHGAALKEYAAMANTPEASPAMRSTSRIMAARVLVGRRRFAEAASAYRALAARKDALLSDRMEAQEALAEIARLKAGKPARDPSASRVRLPSAPTPAVELFVAPNGSDEAPGSAARPLRTLGGAVEAVRALRRRGPLPKGGVAVTFASGTYRVASTVELGAPDSGTPTAPVVYRAAPGASVLFVGGARLSAPGPVTDPDLLARIPEAARSKAVLLDLRGSGVEDPGKLTPTGVGAVPSPMPELFWNGRPLTLARWPNTGWLKTGAVVEERNGAGGFTFAFASERLARWASEPDAWLLGYWGWLWADGGVRAAAFDSARGTIATAHQSSYGARADMLWFIMNALCELDAPGEWHLDARRGVAVVYPPDARPAVVEYPVLEGAFVRMKGVSHVRFERLGFELGRWNAIEIEGGSGVLVAGCRIGRMRGAAVTIEGGTGHGVFGCDLHTLGRHGVSVKGGDRKTLTPSGHFVENCRIRDFSRIDRTYTPAVYAEGVAIRIAHNLITDSPGHAMRIEGNDHVIEYNDVRRVVTETDDQGALDMWYNPTYRGVIIRYNNWADIGTRADDRMRAGIRLDDAICGVLIYGNRFVRAADGLFGGVQIHGGKENEVVNNLFVDCRYGVSFSRWGADRWRQYTSSDAFVQATTTAVDISAPPYSERYPALAGLRECPDQNVVARNVVINCGAFLTRDGGVQDVVDNEVAARAGSRAGGVSAVRSGYRPIPLAEMGRYAHPLAVGPLPIGRRPAAAK